ncbi:MAG: anti-sigma factor [Bacteroidota bacterium]
MNKEQFLNTGLLEQYALGLTDNEESQIVEQHLQAFPELKEELQAMQSALEQYAQQYAIQPPSGLKNKILQDLEETPTNNIETPKSNAFSTSVPWSKWLSYAALIALTAGYLFKSHQINLAKQEIRQQQTAIASCNDRNESLEASQAIYAFISDPNTQPVLLKGTVVSPESEAVVYWNEDKESAYFFASALPKPPSDKQYQIWADVEGEMISVGLLDYQTKDLQQINYIANAESLNITLEPTGGSDHPNVEQLYVNSPLG